MTSTTGGNDVSRYGNDGSLGSVLSFAPDIHNEPDGAMYFPGNHSDSMISIPNDANSSLRLNHDSFSVSGFFKPEAGPGGPIFAYWQSGLGNKLWFFGDNDHEVEILVGDEGGGGSEMLKTWWGPIAFLARVDFLYPCLRQSHREAYRLEEWATLPGERCHSWSCT